MHKKYIYLLPIIYLFIFLFFRVYVQYINFSFEWWLTDTLSLIIGTVSMVAGAPVTFVAAPLLILLGSLLDGIATEIVRAGIGVIVYGSIGWLIDRHRHRRFAQYGDSKQQRRSMLLISLLALVGGMVLGVLMPHFSTIAPHANTLVFLFLGVGTINQLRRYHSSISQSELIALQFLLIFPTMAMIVLGNLLSMDLPELYDNMWNPLAIYLPTLWDFIKNQIKKMVSKREKAS